MPDDNKNREDVAATLADTLVAQGLTPDQIAALVGALDRLETKPTQADWSRAARLFSIQKGLPVAEDSVIEHKWTDPYKISARKTENEFTAAFNAIEPLLESGLFGNAIKSLKPNPENPDVEDAALFDIVLSLLATITEMPAPHETAFHIIGDLLYLMATTGHRRAMWSLAWHLRVLAAHPDTKIEQAQETIRTAEMWETLGLWTRRQIPDWNVPEGLLPAADRWQAAETWLRNVSAPLSMLISHSRFTINAPAVKSVALPRPDTSQADVKSDSSSDVDAQPKKTLRLLDRIGGVAEKDDETQAWAKTKPWRVLLEPLPVVGAFDPDETYAILRREFPWMEDANRAIGQMVAGLAAGRPRLAPLLVTGDPGIGKTAWALRVADLCQLPRMLISLSTTASAMLIAGDEREWSSSGPCLAAKVARETKVANPFIILDELEKAGSFSNTNSAHEALLPILDCDDKRPYFDLFLQGNLDLVRFNWLFLANSLTGISAPLLDRLTVIPARRPTIEEIARRLPDMIAAWLPGEDIGEDVRQQALAKFRETRSLRDMRAIVERSSLQALWQAPGPKAV